MIICFSKHAHSLNVFFVVTEEVQSLQGTQSSWSMLSSKTQPKSSKTSSPGTTSEPQALKRPQLPSPVPQGPQVVRPLGQRHWAPWSPPQGSPSSPPHLHLHPPLRLGARLGRGCHQTWDSLSPCLSLWRMLTLSWLYWLLRPCTRSDTLACQWPSLVARSPPPPAPGDLSLCGLWALAVLTALQNTMEGATAQVVRPDPAPLTTVSTTAQSAQEYLSPPPSPPALRTHLRPCLKPLILPHTTSSPVSLLLPLSENSSSLLIPSLPLSILRLLLPLLLVVVIQWGARGLLPITVLLQLPLMPLSSQSDLWHRPPSSPLKQSPVPLPNLEKTSLL